MTGRGRKSRTSLGRRRAAIYVLVLGTAMIVTVMGLSALTSARIRLTAQDEAAYVTEARLYAQSALEAGLYLVDRDLNWRTNHPVGTWFSNRPIGRGTFSLQAAYPANANLQINVNQPMYLLGIGQRGAATWITRCTLLPRKESIDALKSCLHASQGVRNNLLQVLTLGGGPLSSNQNVNNAGVITGNVEADSFTGIIPVGALVAPAAKKEMPRSTVADEYKARATTVPGGLSSIDRQVVAPGITPWGVNHADGVYYIRTNSDVTIRRARILGTLVIDAPGQRLTIDDEVFWQPARRDYPALIFTGDEVRIRTSMAGLNESGGNLNPPGAPHNGVTDTDNSDSYPNRLEGLYHIRGNLKMEQNVTLVGSILCEGEVENKGLTTLTHDSQLVTHPPIGYETNCRMQVVPGSVQRTVLP